MFISSFGYEKVQIRNLRLDKKTGIWSWELRYLADFTNGEFTPWESFVTSKNGAGLLIFRWKKEWKEVFRISEWKINAKTKSGAYKKIKRLYGKYV